MKVNCGGDVAESFAVFGSDLLDEPVAGAASVRGSKVANGSRRAVESGFPRRSRGRFGSSIGSSEAEVEAFAVFVFFSVSLSRRRRHRSRRRGRGCGLLLVFFLFLLLFLFVFLLLSVFIRAAIGGGLV